MLRAHAESYHGVVVLALATMLTGCFGPSRDDGADGFPDVLPPDLDAIPDATPRDEARSRYGNPKEYEVFGKRYFVLNNAEGYKEQGGASWYGTKFHGRRTSSGEPYDMFKMTAAHKSLPLPTYARVTNLGNGRSVVVRVNDRGPFHPGRIIDLSYAAANRLGILQAGSAQVEVEAIQPGDASAAATPTFLEVGRFVDPIEAVAVREQVGDLGIDAVQIRTESGATQTLHRVLVGPFRDPDALASARQRLADGAIQTAPVPQ